MEILKQLLISFLSTIGFSMMFSSPKETLFHTGLAGASGWLLYSIATKLFNSVIVGSFFGALTVGILGEIFARLNKKPATLYITPGIIPLVPGAGMYYTMLALIENDFSQALNKGVETFFISAAISIGIIISSVLSKSIKRVRQKD